MHSLLSASLICLIVWATHVTAATTRIVTKTGTVYCTAAYGPTAVKPIPRTTYAAYTHSHTTIYNTFTPTSTVTPAPLTVTSITPVTVTTTSTLDASTDTETLTVTTTTSSTEIDLVNSTTTQTVTSTSFFTTSPTVTTITYIETSAPAKRSASHAPPAVVSSKTAYTTMLVCYRTVTWLTETILSATAPVTTITLPTVTVQITSTSTVTVQSLITPPVVTFNTTITKTSTVRQTNSSTVVETDTATSSTTTTVTATTATVTATSTVVNDCVNGNTLEGGFFNLNGTSYCGSTCIPGFFGDQDLDQFGSQPSWSACLAQGGDNLELTVIYDLFTGQCWAHGFSLLDTGGSLQPDVRYNCFDYRTS